MRRYIEIPLFSILNNHELADSEILSRAYNEIAVLILMEENYNVRLFYNRLVYAKLEYGHLLLKISNNASQPIKDLYIPLAEKTIELIDSQIIYLKNVLVNIDPKELFNNYPKCDFSVKFTGDQADLVELAYSCREAKIFNDGDIEIKKLVEYLCLVFSFKVKDCYNIFNNVIRIRKGSRTKLLDKLKDVLDIKMINSDNGIYEKAKSKHTVS